MSLAEAVRAEPARVPAAVAAPPARPGALSRLVRGELSLVFGRRRNRILLLLLAAVPLLVGIAVKVSPPAGADGPAFINRITGNGLFLALTALDVTIPIFLPLAVGIIAADAIAGEAGVGTLRYLLVVPVRRGRLLVAKAAGISAYAVLAVLAIGVVSLIAGAALFGTTSFTLLGGQQVGLAQALLRIIAVMAYVILSLSGLLAVGLLISTLTEVPVAAMASTVGFVIVGQVLDALPQLSAIHGAILTHWWSGFGDLLRVGPDYALLGEHLLVQVAYVALAGSLAWARFGNADITS